MRRSAISSYLACPQQHQYRWVEGLVPPQMHLAPFTGVVFHTQMQLWLSSIPNQRSEAGLIGCLRVALSEHQHEVEEDRFEEAKGLLKVMTRAYYQQFGNDELLYGRTEIPLEYQGFTCTLDGIAERPDGLWLLEHKTGDPDDEMLVLNSFQTDFYHYVARATGLLLKGTICTIVQRPRSDEPKKLPSVRRYEMEVSEAAIEDAWRTAVEVRWNAEQLKQVHRNRGTHCSWCDFKWICRTALLGGDEEGVKTQMFMKEEHA